MTMSGPDKKAPSAKSMAWPLFDAIVREAPLRRLNPWDSRGLYHPDFDTLERLLGVPLHLEAKITTGVPALALDVWAAYELRRAGIDPDAVWPREEPPRTVSRDVLAFIQGVPKAMRDDLMARLRKGSGPGRVAAATANILGKNYLKQVDVIVSGWQTGPEVLISTKRMDSSFGKNALNRVEESYGDAKNLALRHPYAALGYLYSLRSTAYTSERKQYDLLVDLIAKLAREQDAYDACCLIVPEWSGHVEDDENQADLDKTAIGPDDVEIEDTEEEEQIEPSELTAALLNLPRVRIRHDLIPEELSAARFFKTLLDLLLQSTPISLHIRARELQRAAQQYMGNQEPSIG